MRPRIGVAGWAIPKALSTRFPETGSHLERYAAVFPAVEINSSFYRDHRPATYARWAASTPAEFRFAVKLSREITHVRRLQSADEPLDRFLGAVTLLGRRLGPVLVQLPPSFAYDAVLVRGFFSALRERHRGPVVCEPRHPSWFTPEATATLMERGISRVAADPAVVPVAAEPGGSQEAVYYRLHGTPRVYYSAYSPEFLALLASRLREHRGEVWCIFDNTALGAAQANALDLLARYPPAPTPLS